MSGGTQLVYGDGWDDIKVRVVIYLYLYNLYFNYIYQTLYNFKMLLLKQDCFGASRIGRGGGGGRTSRPGSSRSGSFYYGDGVEGRRSGANCEDCLGDLEEFCGCNICGSGSTGGTCSRTRICLGILLLWLFILTIVCIVLGSNIGKRYGI